MAAANSTDTRRTVLITGATGGIGRATAIAFAKRGAYDLALHYNGADQQTREEVLRAIQGSTGDKATVKVAFFQADLGNYDSVRALHEQVINHFGTGVDVLFNNAGTNAGFSSVKSLADVPIDVFDQTWRVNTGSSILLTQLCLPHMEGQKWGRIVFNSSVAAFTGGVVGPHYASSKSAMHGFVHWLANNVAANGVTVNGVAPALIGDTTMMGSSEDEELQKRVAGKIPVGRLGKPDEIAETVLWMVNTAYVTNKIIGVDGGYYPY